MKDMICSNNATLLNAMELIQKNGKRTVFVVDNKNKLCGVITDGDIRELILSSCPLSEKISANLHKKFVYAREGDDYSKLIAGLGPKIKIVPVVNKKMEITDYIQIDKDVHIPIASLALDGNEFRYLTNAFLSTWISSTGYYIDRFEQEFAKFCGVKYGVAVSSGTTALHLAMMALGIGPGDEVILPDLTFAASINTILHANAKPVIVDIENDSWTIDPKEIEKAITPRTRAIMPVHIYGQPSNMGEIMRIAKKHKLFVVEDCAEAHGAKFKSKKVGSFGDIGCFSFYANKVITTGEGGMCVTNSKKLYDKMRVLRDHGMSKKKKYWHDDVGYNYRMTNLQAAIGCAQLEKIERNLSERKNIEKGYRKTLSDFKFVKFQNQLPGRDRITWLVSVLLTQGKRDKLFNLLSEHKIDARPFFYSLGDMPIYKKYLFSNSNSKKISGMGLNLPTQIGVNANELERVRVVLSKFSTK